MTLRRSGLFPAIVSLAGLSFTLLLWNTLRFEQGSQIIREVSLQTQKIRSQTTSELRSRILALVRLSRRWELEGRPSYPHWESEGKLLVAHSPGLQALEWIDPQYHVRWIAPGTGSLGILSRDTRLEGPRRTAAMAAVHRRQAMITAPIRFLSGKAGFMVFIPVFHAGKFEGFTEGVFNFQKLFSSFLEADPHYHLSIAMNGKTVYQSTAGQSGGSRWQQKAELQLYGTAWEFAVEPTADFMVARHTGLSRLILAFGSLLSLLFGISLYVMQQAWTQARRLKKSESALHQSRTELEKIVKERTVELQHAVDDLHEENTERRGAEQELKQRDSEIRLITDSLPVLIADIDEKERYRFVNQAYEEWFNLPKNELVGKTVQEIMDAASYDGFRLQIRRVLAGNPTKFQSTLRNKRGDRRIMDITLVPNLQDNQIHGFFTLAQDVTERVRSEDRLRESAARFRAMSDASPLGIFLTDAAGSCIYTNRTFQEIVGLSLQETLDKGWFSAVHPENRDDLLKGWYHAFREQEIYVQTHRFVRNDGATVWATVKAAPIRDSRVLSGYVGMVDDISERRRGDQALKESEARYRFLADSIPQMVWTARPDGFLDYFNKQWVDYTGMSTEQTQRSSWAPILHPEDLDHCNATWKQSVEKGEGYEIEYRFKRAADGMYRWHLGRAVPLRDASGKIVKWFGTCTDIHDQKLFQMELREAKVAAEAATAAKSNFLTNISHEIRTPINGILGTTGLLLDTKLTPEQKEFAEILYTSGDNLLAIINDLLDLSKIEARKLTLDIHDMDLSQVIETTVTFFCERVHQKKLEFVTRIGADLPTALRGDPSRLRQVLTNLISNAIKYTERGEVILAVTKEAETPKRVELRFEITDTGIGLSAEQQVHLFQPFYQVDSSAARSQGGTGLGLAISRELCDLMGGKIGVQSVPRQGATFWFTLTCDKQAGAVQGKNPASFKGLPVLVVDDNLANRQALAQQLAAWGMQVSEASNAEEALRLLRTPPGKQPFSAALIDLQMPKPDGLELVSRIKGDSDIAATRIILMTSITRYVWNEKLRTAEVAAFVTKPVLYSQLYDAFSNLANPRAGPVPESNAEVTRAKVRPDGKPVRILLAEDNPINQTVAIRQLNRLGYSIDSASNGREVLEAVAQTPYDVILMDCQMPEVDGYQATRLIREREASVPNTPTHVTIIAMTAHALKEDREKCLKAGMDDYVSKPVKPAELAQVLEKWLEGKAASPTAPFSKGGVDNTAEIDQEQLIATLGADGLEGSGLVNLYIQSTESNFRELDQAISNNAVAEIERLAHSSAGANAMVGMNRMARLLRQLEHDAKNQKIETATPLLAELKVEFEKIKTYLVKYGDESQREAMA